MKQAAIHLLVALPAEARPLITHFGLKRQQPDGDFPLYRSENIALVRSGVGRDAAAAAARFLATKWNLHQPAAWLNIGIAGHATRTVGSPILAKAVHDNATGERWELDLSFAPPCDTELLTTLEQPEFDYDRPEAFDMEAAGFIATIKTLDPSAIAHCFKIISDNRANPAKGINGPMVSRLIGDQIETIQSLVQRLTTTTTQYQTNNYGTR
jgi:hypothetical protein